MTQTEETELLYRKHYGRMRMVAQTMLGDAESARDVVNDVFADILYGRMVVPKACCDGWWTVCVRNRCLNILSRQSVRQRMEAATMPCPDSGQAEEEEVLAEQIDGTMDKLDRINKFIDEKLTPQTRRIIRMHYGEKKKYRQIAAELGISETAVYKHLAKGIKQIKEEFE